MQWGQLDIPGWMIGFDFNLGFYKPLSESLIQEG